VRRHGVCLVSVIPNVRDGDPMDRDGVSVLRLIQLESSSGQGIQHSSGGAATSFHLFKASHNTVIIFISQSIGTKPDQPVSTTTSSEADLIIKTRLASQGNPRSLLTT
jgi:hypothetical protein